LAILGDAPVKAKKVNHAMSVKIIIHLLSSYDTSSMPMIDTGGKVAYD
jgi:hypothetical protein